MRRSIFRIIKLRDGEALQPIAQFHPDFVEDLKLLRPPRSEFLFRETDASLLAGRNIRMVVWNTCGDSNQPLESTPRPGSRWFVLRFPFKIFGQKITRFYTLDAGKRILAQCQQTIEKYKIINADHEAFTRSEVHPILAFVECSYLPCETPPPVILAIPENLSRQQYLAWIEQFMRDIYELLLNVSFKPLGPACLDYTFGFLEDNASATGKFRAKAIVRPVSPNGQTFPDDFAVASFAALPGKRMRVVIHASNRWMLNRHTNARPVVRDHTGAKIGWGMESDEDSEDPELAASHSDSESEPGSGSEDWLMQASWWHPSLAGAGFLSEKESFPSPPEVLVFNFTFGVPGRSSYMR